MQRGLRRREPLLLTPHGRPSGVELTLVTPRARGVRWLLLAAALVALAAAACAVEPENGEVDPTETLPAPTVEPTPLETAVPSTPVDTPATEAAGPTPRPTTTSSTALPVRPAAEACGDPRYEAPASVPAMAPWTRPALERDADLETLIRDTLGNAAGSASVVVVDIENDRIAEVNGNRQWYAASLYKLFVMFEAMWQEQEGVLDANAPVAVTCWYERMDLGTLSAVGIEPGAPIPVHEAVRYMIVASDNALATLVYDVVGGRHIAARLAALGTTGTDVTTSALPTTAADVALVLEAIARGLPGEPAAAEMRALLEEQWFRTRIPTGIPADGSSVGNKTGDLAGAAHDAAIVTAPFGAYVIAILTNGAVGDQAFIDLAGAVHEYFATASR